MRGINENSVGFRDVILYASHRTSTSWSIKYFTLDGLELRHVGERVLGLENSPREGLLSCEPPGPISRDTLRFKDSLC